MKAAATVEAAACLGELAAWCGGWQGQLGAVPDQLAAAVRRLALAALLQDRLAEDSPAAADGVKLLDVLPEVAAAVPVRAVPLSVLLSLPYSPAAAPQTRDRPVRTYAQGHQQEEGGCVCGGVQTQPHGSSNHTAAAATSHQPQPRTSIPGSNGKPAQLRAPGHTGAAVSVCAPPTRVVGRPVAGSGSGEIQDTRLLQMRPCVVQSFIRFIGIVRVAQNTR